MIEDDTPTLWELRKHIGQPATIAVLVKALTHAAKLVSLEKNLTIEQIGEAANDMLEEYGYLKVEEVKYLLKRGMRTQSVYGRLDYNVIMGWVSQYDSERTEEAMRIADQQASQAENKQPDADAVDFETYLKSLKERAKTDEVAAQLLSDINKPHEGVKLLTNEERAKQDHDFKMWRTFKYLLGDKK